MKSKVFVTNIKESLNKSSMDESSIDDAIRACFDSFGGVNKIVKGDVFIKINAAMPDTSAITNLEVILSTIKTVTKATPKPNNVYVFDSAANGFPTRMVYLVDDMAKHIKKLGAIPLYLDEQPHVMFDFQGTILDKPIPVPKILYEKLIVEKGQNTYINIPRLKMHPQSGITACVKNQHGLIYDEDKLYMHHCIHEKMVDMYRKFKPDFNILDAITVTNHNNFVFDDSWLIPYNLLLAGTDAVAVDAAGACLMGVDPLEIGHISLAGEEGLGVADLDRIDILPNPEILKENRKILNNDPDKVPVNAAPGVNFIEGKNKCCPAGCRYISFFLKYITNGTKCRSFTAIAGQGHDPALLDKHNGPFLLTGPCAIKELESYFKERKRMGEKLKIYRIHSHFSTSEYMKVVLKISKVPFSRGLDLLQIPFARMIWGLVSAAVHRARYNGVT